MQQPGVLSIWVSILLPQKYRKYLSHQEVFPYETWDWIIYTGLHNTGSSLLSNTILALTGGSPGPFQSWGHGSLRAHSVFLKTWLCIYICPSELHIISLKYVGLFQFHLFQPVSAGLFQNWQHQKLQRSYTYYIKLQLREERLIWMSHGEKTCMKFSPVSYGFVLGLYQAACGHGWLTSTWVTWALSWSTSLGALKEPGVLSGCL